MKTALRENRAEWGVLDISRWDVGSHAERVPFDYGPEGSEGMSLSLSRKCSMQRDLRVLKNAKVGWFFFSSKTFRRDWIVGESSEKW